MNSTSIRRGILLLICAPVLAWGFQAGNRIIHDKIKADLQKYKALAAISVTVDQQEVVLTGTVASAKLQKQAGRIARMDAPGMRLLNYIAVQRKHSHS